MRGLNGLGGFGLDSGMERILGGKVAGVVVLTFRLRWQEHYRRSGFEESGTGWWWRRVGLVGRGLRSRSRPREGWM